MMITELAGQLKDKRVVLRVDLNVPVTSNGKIADATRIDRILPTIEFLKDQGAKIILISHFGRPKGKRDSQLSLCFLVEYLEQKFNTKVYFHDDCIGDIAVQVSKSLEASQVLLLENLRFHAEEEENDNSFAKELSRLGDGIYINDAFSCSHRAHASIIGITKYCKTYYGFLLRKELDNLNYILNAEGSKVTAIVAGKKVSTKFKVLSFLADRVENLVIAGAMANTFLKAKGLEIGKSFYEQDYIAESLKLLEEKKCNIVLPCDVACAKQAVSGFSDPYYCNITEITDECVILDIYNKSIDEIKRAIQNSDIIVWNGPVGMFEDDRFFYGTHEIASYVANLTEQGVLKSIVGGGDTIAAIKKANLENSFSYVSTGGGAFLEWLEAGSLVGIKKDVF